MRAVVDFRTCLIAAKPRDSRLCGMTQKWDDFSENKLRRFFSGKGGLPVLGRVKDMQDIDLFVVELKNDKMPMPAGFATKNAISQIWSMAHRFAVTIATSEFVDLFLQVA